MPEKVQYNEELNLIEISSYGMVTEADLTSSIKDIIHYIQETGSEKVFIDTLEQTSYPGAHTISRIVSSMPNEVRYAVLASEQQSTYEDLIFSETVSYNRGITLKIFNTKDAIQEWLAG